MLARKPIMSPDLERQVMNAVAQYTNRNQWKKWGMLGIRKQGVAILLKGPSGCGKTKIAEYLSLVIRKRGIKELSFADFGSHVPGENARQIRENFDWAKENGGMTVFLDECEAVLWNRSRAGGSAMWMLEVIDELLVQIGKYPFLTILASNKSELLDPAIDRRLIATIHVGLPEYRERLAMWRIMVPKSFPVKLTLEQTDKLAKHIISGAEIENAIIMCASEAIRIKKNPTFTNLLACAEHYAQQRTIRDEQHANEARIVG